MTWERNGQTKKKKEQNIPFMMKLDIHLNYFTIELSGICRISETFQQWNTCERRHSQWENQTERNGPGGFKTHRNGRAWCRAECPLCGCRGIACKQKATKHNRVAKQQNRFVPREIIFFVFFFSEKWNVYQREYIAILEFCVTWGQSKALCRAA